MIEYIKNKNLCPQKDISKMKRQVPDWGKIFELHKSDKGFLFKIYKECQQIDVKRQTTIKMDSELEQTFQKRYINGV